MTDLLDEFESIVERMTTDDSGLELEYSQVRTKLESLVDNYAQLIKDNRQLRFRLADEQDEVNRLNGLIYHLKHEASND